MPNIRSAKKRVRVSATKELHNKMIKTALRTSVKKAKAAVETSADNKNEVYTDAVKTIDRAVAKGILHKNTAARKKSALTKKLNASAKA